MTLRLDAWKRWITALGCAVLIVTAQAAAQGPAQGHESGVTASMDLNGTSSKWGRIFELDSSVGYAITRNLSLDAGVPFYAYQAPTMTSTNPASGGQLGNPDVGFHFNFPNQLLGYNMSVT